VVKHTGRYKHVPRAKRPKVNQVNRVRTKQLTVPSAAEFLELTDREEEFVELAVLAHAKDIEEDNPPTLIATSRWGDQNCRGLGQDAGHLIAEGAATHWNLERTGSSRNRSFGEADDNFMAVQCGIYSMVRAHLASCYLDKAYKDRRGSGTDYPVSIYQEAKNLVQGRLRPHFFESANDNQYGHLQEPCIQSSAEDSGAGSTPAGSKRKHNEGEGGEGHLTVEKVKRLKVGELRLELASRGLATGGVKSDLAARLERCLG
jgi:hypothetical protein